MARYIFHDPFARFTLYRETKLIENAGEGLEQKGCRWCGALKHTRTGKPFLFAYYTENDSSLQSRKNYVPGLYCSLGCERSFNEE